MNKDDELDKILSAMEKVFGSKYGLANIMYSSENIERDFIPKDFINYYVGNLIPMYYSYVSNNEIEQYSGSGCSLNPKRSLIKAYGEFIERYSASKFESNNDEIVVDSFNNLCKVHECLSMRELIHFDREVYGKQESFYSKYSDDSIIMWVKGTDLVKSRDVFLPAQKVFLGINLEYGELPYIQWLSTGLACGFGKERAILGALYEVIERDSFVLTWKLKLPGRKILMDRIENTDLLKLYNHITKSLLGEDELHIYDISRTDGIYTVLTFIKNDNSESFGLITSAAADIDIEKALLKSLEELCLTYKFAYRLFLQNYGCQKLSKEDVIDLDKHLLYYGTGSRSDSFDFICELNEEIKLSEMVGFIQDDTTKNHLEYLIKLFRDKNKSIYIYDLASPEIKEIGINVVRAIIPEYNDLEINHKYNLNDNPRLLEYREIYNREINDEPHPFP